MSNTHVEYGWKDAEQKSSHEYLLPATLEEVRLLARDRPLRILDLGCGNGYISAQLAALGHEVIGVDSSTDGIEAARAAYSTRYPNARFHVASVYDDDLRSVVGDPVDCVVSLEVVEHLYLPRALLTQSHAVLRDGGLLICTTPYHGYLKNLAISLLGGWDRHWAVDWDGGHVKFFSPASLIGLAREAGFREPRIRGLGRVRGFWKSMMLIARR